MHKKNKSNIFCQSVMLQILAASFCSLKITVLFSLVKAKKNPSDFIKFLHISSTLKMFHVKQGLGEWQMARR